MNARTVYRPVGPKELGLILDADARAFPPRLPEQPIFYPVLELDYAIQIARDWNAPHPPGFAGFVTAFEVEAEYLSQHEPHQVGASVHRELWIPADQLPEFNAHLASRIRTPLAFYGPGYRSPAPTSDHLRGLDLGEQLRALHALLEQGSPDFIEEIAANWTLILANYGFWSARPPEEQSLTAAEATRTLTAIDRTWREGHPDLLLPKGALVGFSEPGSSPRM